MKKTIFVLGNLLLEEDSLPFKIIKRLEREFPWIEFREFDPSEEFSEEPIFLDTLIGVTKVSLIEDINKIEAKKSCSVHGFDLSLALKLLKKIGKIKRVKIIGLPPRMKEEAAFLQTKTLIQSLI
jgi:Ni,Fe-hydrogenase maturation factor